MKVGKGEKETKLENPTEAERLVLLICFLELPVLYQSYHVRDTMDFRI